MKPLIIPECIDCEATGRQWIQTAEDDSMPCGDACPRCDGAGTNYTPGCTCCGNGRAVGRFLCLTNGVAVDVMYLCDECRGMRLEPQDSLSETTDYYATDAEIESGYNWMSKQIAKSLPKEMTK